MNSCDELRAKVKREPNRLIVNIEEEDQAKAGIASLACEFVSGHRPMGHRRLVGKLEEELAQAKELLDATGKRLHKLRMKKQEYGAVALSAEEAAELREKEKEARQLREEIARLEAQIREESVLSSDDSRPHLK